MPKHNSSMLIHVNMHNYLYANYIIIKRTSQSTAIKKFITSLLRQFWLLRLIHKQFQASAMFDNILYKTKNDPNSGNVLFISKSKKTYRCSFRNYHSVTHTRLNIFFKILKFCYFSFIILFKYMDWNIRNGCPGVVLTLLIHSV